jgi:hypothetical protein
LLSVQQQDINYFEVAPNPASETISVSFPNGFNSATITFYNTLGQLILEKKVSQSFPTVVLQQLNSGVYFYKIEANSFSQSGKLIKK